MLAPKLAVIFRHLDKGGNSLVCWNLADVVSEPKESSCSDVGDYWPISIIHVLSEVFQKIEARKLSHPLKLTVRFLLFSFRMEEA